MPSVDPTGRRAQKRLVGRRDGTGCGRRRRGKGRTGRDFGPVGKERRDKGVSEATRASPPMDVVATPRLLWMLSRASPRRRFSPHARGEGERRRRVESEEGENGGHNGKGREGPTAIAGGGEERERRSVRSGEGERR